MLSFCHTCITFCMLSYVWSFYVSQCFVCAFLLATILKSYVTLSWSCVAIQLHNEFLLAVDYLLTYLLTNSCRCKTYEVKLTSMQPTELERSGSWERSLRWASRHYNDDDTATFCFNFRGFNFSSSARATTQQLRLLTSGQRVNNTIHEMKLTSSSLKKLPPPCWRYTMLLRSNIVNICCNAVCEQILA